MFYFLLCYLSRAARRVLAPVLVALAALPTLAAAVDPRLSALDAQVAAWARDTGQQVPGPALRRGVVWRTRLHGLLNLEIEGHFASMGFDPALLYDAEVDARLDDVSVVDRVTANGTDGAARLANSGRAS